MTVKELMEQVDADKVTEAFLLTFYLFHHDCYELSISEKFNAISKARELISYNINLFKSCTQTTDGKKYTIFIMYDQDDEDFENKESKSFSCFAIRDEEAFSVLDKNFYLYTGEGETELSHYSFDHEKICDMAAFTIAKSSIDILGKEICVAKILSDMFFWGVYPEDREKNINKLEEKISKPYEESKGISLEEFEEKIKILESEIMEQMTEDEKLYYEAKDRFKEETKDIIRRYRKNLYRELEKQHIEIIREEYQGRMQNCAKTEWR